MEFVYVPSGAFTMGSTDQQLADLKKKYPNTDDFDGEVPQRKVTLDAYWIGKFEVTNAQFDKFSKASNYVTDIDKKRKPSPINPRTGKRFSRIGNDNQPVVWMSWNDAAAYCKWAGGRLPTEAEWEKAARGTDGRIFPWGNQWDGSRCHSSESRQMKTVPVGSFPQGVSPFGCHDMAGNVAEWCADWFDKDSYRNAPAKNPKGPKSREMRVLRGGSWSANADGLRASYRGKLSPTQATMTQGFRVAWGG
jgi:formylglycine-generating enzyme required for sulfatase activity